MTHILQVLSFARFFIYLQINFTEFAPLPLTPSTMLPSTQMFHPGLNTVRLLQGEE